MSFQIKQHCRSVRTAAAEARTVGHALDKTQFQPGREARCFRIELPCPRYGIAFGINTRFVAMKPQTLAPSRTSISSAGCVRGRKRLNNV